MTILKANKNLPPAPSFLTIGLLGSLRKILDRVLLHRISIHLDDHGIIQDEEFWFRDKHATSAF